MRQPTYYSPAQRGALMPVTRSPRNVIRRDPSLKDVQSATPAKNDTGKPVTPSEKAGREEEKKPGTPEQEGLWSGLKEIFG